ncbi:heterokaryon incompatibility protein-domain-containing protein [Hypoxylon rubiginosum]|uniref:Heterokaryon incompatibility protein-domain-containing protein n=1 Tax=Hypoxylon rubiginosum TaxID=110542 RepID=A0ACB9Z749_9PEZI|nr:heterokaryon incompatibility protein-domain-containing protein [Hypoxylon rubiginosum]
MSSSSNPLKRRRAGSSPKPPRAKRNTKSSSITTYRDPVYGRLDPSRRQIRLLRPTWRTRYTSSTLGYTLETVSLDDNIDFVALSYVWGDESITKDIYLNGRRRAITTNLASALLHLNKYSLVSEYVVPAKNGTSSETNSDDEFEEHDKSTRDDDDEAYYEHVAGSLKTVMLYNEELRVSVSFATTLLWVDALCINQGDLSERSQQIQLMGDIYGKAEGVFSWIDSSGGKNINLALKGLRELSPDLRSHSDLSWMYLHPELCVLDNSNGRIRNKYWDAFREFENSEYFQRLWIFQELWIGCERVLFISDDECLPLVSLLHYCTWADDMHRKPLNQTPPRIMSADLWYRLYRQIPRFEYQYSNLSPMVEGVGFDIARFLSITRMCRCKDARDKVYGLLGVFKMEISPDYEKAVEDLYVDWATDPILNIPPTTLLLLSGIGNYPRSDKRVLRSWVPDLEFLNDQLALVKYKDYPKLPVDLQEHPTRFRSRVSRTKGITCFSVQDSEVSKVCTEGLSPTDKQDFFEVRVWLSWLTILKYLANNKAYLLSDPDLNKCNKFRDFIKTLVYISRGPEADVLNSGGDSDFILPDLIDRFSTSTLFRQLLIQTHVAITRLEELRQSQYQPILKSNLDMWKMWIDMWEMRAFNVEKYDEPDMELDSYLSATLFGQVVFHTSSGLIGVGPPGMMATDKVYLIHGLRLPVLLREVDGKLVNVGACYIHGISDEASLEILKEKENDVQEINIV